MRWVVPAEAKQPQRFLAQLLLTRMPPCMRILPLPSRRGHGFQVGAVVFVLPLRPFQSLRRPQSLSLVFVERKVYVPPASPYPEAIVAV